MVFLSLLMWFVLPVAASWQSFDKYGSRSVERESGAVVGQLLITTSNGRHSRRVTYCNGVLLERDRLLTNAHCLEGHRNFVVEARFNWGFASARPTVIKCRTVLRKVRRLDYAVLQCDSGGLRAAQMGEPGVQQRIFIVQHNCSRGSGCRRPKKVSHGVVSGRFFNVPVNGNRGRYYVDELYRTTAYARRGSSGAGVFDQQSGRLVGLYKGGSRSADFVPIGRILQDLRRNGL